MLPTTRGRRRLAALTLVLLPTALLTPLVPFAADASAPVVTGQSAPATDDPGDDPTNNTQGDLQLVTSSLPSFKAGQEGWVSLIWTAGTDMCDIRVTTKSKTVGVTYPTNTGGFSSMYINSALAEGNSDYTAFKLTAPATAGPQEIEFEATYTRLKDSATLKKADNLVVKNVTDCSGNSGKVKQTISLPVTAASGPAVTLATPSLSLRAGGPTWVSIGFTGNAPGLDNFRVTLTPPAGFEVVYPGDGSSSGLAQGTRLGVGATDAAGVRLDPLVTPAGTYSVPVKATWDGGSFTGTISVTVTR
ncbi:hypothetical protein [Nocardioides sp. LS1]|uniref:hypothetical protein n=1 Tax=Nocardioides sp. LS1 TaxID=1027620 RepID=UPI000F622342|nr:hypothetical protein [Nocardioides sp. LS1]GCD89882.1 hypothetical protein NLS1_18880 [Nocardioides sp. LS1]